MGGVIIIQMKNSPSAATSKNDNLPFCIQGSEAPVFRGEFETGEHLECSSGCGQLLIEHYDKDDYATIGIRCFRCGEITWTPTLTLGEVFSASVVSLGDKGKFLLGSTVNTHSGVVLTCDQEIKREIEATAPREDLLPLTLTNEGLQSLVAEYDGIVGGKYAVQKKIVNRLGISSIKTFPFAWSIAHLEECLLTGNIDIRRKETLTALIWLHTFSHVVGTWQHHPRFQFVARDLGKPKSFLHTSSQLIAAAYLYRAGNRIGLSLENIKGEPNPDLYLRVAGRDRLFLEVKAPEALQWGGDGSISIEQIETAVESCIKRSSDQINRTHRGVLIISSSYVSNYFPELLEKCIIKGLKSRGMHHKNLAAVVGLSPIVMSITSQGQVNSGFRFSTTLNEYYDGANPIVTRAR